MARRGSPAPQSDPDIARIASVLGDPTRVAMLDVLLDGEAHPIGELARAADVSAATASSHLRRLTEAGLVRVEQVGRERRVRLAGVAIAELLERLAALAAPVESWTVGARKRTDELRFARTCYDHLAGVLGVLVTNTLVHRGWLHRTTDTLEPDPALFGWLAMRGHPLELDARRPLTRACFDWSERVHHVAGRVGAAIACIFVNERWVARVRPTRALRVTARGRIALARELGLTLPAQRPT